MDRLSDIFKMRIDFMESLTEKFPESYPNLTNGTIFEESDTGKHYMFDGTDTWNEVT